MGNSPVDRNISYMREVWGTTSLTTDYWSLPKNTPQETPVELKEVLNDEAKAIDINKKEVIMENSYDTIPNRY
jgi:hypothetical protein